MPGGRYISHRGSTVYFEKASDVLSHCTDEIRTVRPSEVSTAAGRLVVLVDRGGLLLVRRRSTIDSVPTSQEAAR